MINNNKQNIIKNIKFNNNDVLSACLDYGSPAVSMVALFRTRVVLCLFFTQVQEFVYFGPYQVRNK